METEQRLEKIRLGLQQKESQELEQLRQRQAEAEQELEELQRRRGERRRLREEEERRREEEERQRLAQEEVPLPVLDRPLRRSSGGSVERQRADCRRSGCQEEKRRMKRDMERRRMEAAERVKIMSSTDGDETFSPLSPRVSTHKVRSGALHRTTLSPAGGSAALHTMC